MYNIRWCTLHNFMNPYFTQLFFLSLPYSDDLHWLELAKDAYLQNPSSSTLRNDGQSWWNGTWTWWSSCGKRLTHKNKWSRIIQSRRWHVFYHVGILSSFQNVPWALDFSSILWSFHDQSENATQHFHCSFLPCEKNSLPPTLHM